MSQLKEDLQQDILVRRRKIQSALRQNGADACLIATTINLFYATGFVYNGYCYLSPEGEPLHFVKRPDGLPLENIVYIRKPEQIAEELQKRGFPLPQKLLLEIDALSYGECLRLLSSLQVDAPLNASVLMRKIRSVKTDFELLQTRACFEAHREVYRQIPALFERGMTDIEFQAEIERVMRLHGSMGFFHTYGNNMDIHMGSLLTGENAEIPSPFDFALGGQGTDPTLPLGAAGLKIEEGNTIMVDMAGNYRPWMTDMTRVYSVGKISGIACKAHQVSIEICDEMGEFARQGVACSELYEKAMRIVKRNRLEAYFMGTRQQAKFVGHGVGLEINEPPVLAPRSNELLEANVVFALEPKFVIPGVGAVGIENTYAVTETGVEKITVFEENIIEL
ncbi:MAG: Xaa-Pro peptidase family protein [Prevotella sp.]|jgi:Xaa-Pro aminopeptidase|nr:Xaa-Pro peptidase family protein [Prevotella sp.]